MNSSSIVGSTTPNNSPFIYSGGDVQINSSSYVYNTAIYAPNNSMTLNSGSTLSGSFVGRSISLSKNTNQITWTTITIPNSLTGSEDTGWGTLSVSTGTWDEVY